MNKKFYHLGRRLSAVFLFCFSIVSFIPNASAQECGSVTLGDDVSICNGYEATLEPTADFTFSGNADKIVSQTGKMSNGYKAEGSPNGSGTYFYRTCYSTYTRGVWRMSCPVPNGAKICLSVKVPSGTAYFKVWGVNNWGTSNVTYTAISTKYVGCTGYRNVCMTSNGNYDYIKVQDLGGNAFYLDAITFEGTCTPSYSWNTGATTQNITVKPTTTTDYVVTATGCGVSVKDTITVNVTDDCGSSCSKTVSNTRGCSNTPYVIWLRDKNGAAHYLSGDSTKYHWTELPNGDARLTAEGISASGLTGTFDVDLTFSGRTTTPPTNSPKYSNCFTVSSTTGWVYWTSTTGTLTSTSYGNMTLSRKGPAAQMGDGANITQDGYGSSGWFNISGGNGHITTGDFNVMLDEECGSDKECERIAGNTRGCAGKPYVIYLVDKYNKAHHLKGDSTKYQWLSYPNGNVRFIAEDISATGLKGTFDVDITFSDKTTTPPTNSPKTSNCFTTGSTTGWEYYETTTGTIKSTCYGNMSLTRKGPAFQLGDGANITEDGFGASGWFNITGSVCDYFKTGDVNVMLSDDCTTGEECEESHEYDPCIVTYGKGSYNRSTTTINISQNVSEIDEIIVEGIYKGGQPTSGNFSNGSTTVNWSSSDANALNNVSGTSNKGYYKATLPAASSVSMYVGNYRDKMHGFVAYVKMKDAYCADNYTSFGDDRYYVYQSTKTTTFSMPATTNAKTITAELPIAEMNNDSRIAKFTLSAGGESKSVTINTYDLDRSMTIQTLELEDVLGSVTSATLTIESPSSGGDSYIAGNVSFNWFLPCESGGGECDESHDYDPCIVAVGKGSTGNTSTTINITQTVSEIDEIIVEGIYKGGQPTYGNFTNGSTTVNWTSSDANELDNVSGTSNKGYYRATLPAASSVTMNVGNYKDKMHGFVAYVKLKDAYCSDNYTAFTDNRYYIYQNSKTSTFSLPTTTNEKTITAMLPIAEMNNDSRIATFELTAGSLSKSVTINTYDLGQSMTIQTLELQGVPGSVTTATLKMTSPSSGGDSYISGNAAINWYLPCETDPGKNRIAGTVFHDVNQDTVLNNGEDGQGNVTVYLYDDKDDDGLLDDDELTPIDTTTTASDGTYEFFVDYVCDPNHFESVVYQSGIVNPNNLLGAPGADYAGFDTDSDNLIVSVRSEIEEGDEYTLYLGTIEAGAYAIISESSDGTNFYYNTSIAITSSNSQPYTVTADRDVKYIKFDKHAINSVSGYNSYGSASTNVYDYKIFGLEGCDKVNSFIVDTDLGTYPNNSSLTTDNYEFAQFDTSGQEDLNNDFGFVFNSTNSYCGSLTVEINKDKVAGSSDMYDFPVYLDITNSKFRYKSTWDFAWEQGMYSPNGWDIQVEDENGDILPIEIVGYDNPAGGNDTLGRIRLWVLVDTLSATSNTKLIIRHGIESGTITNPSTTGVWPEDYKAVYHFEDFDDATQYSNDANNFGGDVMGGFLGQSMDFDGNDYLRVPYSSSLDITGKKLTMSAWVNISSNPSDAAFAVKGPSVNQEAYMFGVDGGTNPIKINSRVTTNNGHYRHDAGSLPKSEWAYVQFVYDGDLSSGQKRVYINGNLSHTRTASGNIKTGNDDLWIGKRVYGDNRYINGRIDELRIACVARSANWIKTEYNNQFSPKTFYTITDSAGCGAVPVTWLDFTAKKVSANDVELNWSTANETNNSHFEVERSTDGVSFEKIGEPIPGAGTTNMISRYEAMDYDLPEGVAYYRIKQIDFDGQFDYSIVRVVDISGRTTMTVWPNPANESINVSFKAGKGNEVVLTNIAGQQLSSTTIDRNGMAVFNTEEYPQGVYFVEIKSSIGSQVKKVIIKK